MRVLFPVLAVIIAFTAVPSYGFDLPDYDPWYYQSDEFRFWIPDKAQHYWGSLALNEVGKRLSLPGGEMTSPVLSFTAGFLYEVWQEGRGIGFSERDLIADALGVITSQLSTSTLKMWLDYSTRDRIITFNIKIYM